MQKMKISKGKLYELISSGLFPKPAKFLDRKITVWLDSEVEIAMIALFKNPNKDYIKKVVSDIEQSRRTWS